MSDEEYDLPQDQLPVFPVRGALLLPGGHLPLHVFEPRYRIMIKNVMSTHGILGMVQPTDDADPPSLYSVGCAGKISTLSETEDGRYLITLTGIRRFKIERELDVHKGGYRVVVPDWSKYEDDDPGGKCLEIDKSRLYPMLESYLVKSGLECDWHLIEQAPDHKLIDALAMICPLDYREKQALLEADCCQARAEMFIKMIDMSVRCCVDEGDCSILRH